MVHNYISPLLRSYFSATFSLSISSRLALREAKLARFRQGSVRVWCQIMCAEESEERVIKAKPLIIMSDSTVVLNLLG